MPAIVGVVETCVYADDLENAERFYGECLGLTLAAREPGRHVFFQVGDRNMLLVFRAEASRRGDSLPPHGATGSTHLALGIAAEDLEAWRNHLQRHGVQIEQQQEWRGGGRSLYFRDPAGNLVELITPCVWGLPSGW